MAGAKGSGLSLMIEVLTGVLAGNAVIAPVLAGRRKGGFNGTVMALDPAAFGDPADFARATGELAAQVQALVPVKGAGAVRLPGERGALEAAQRRVSGIPLARGTVQRLGALAGRLNVALPSELAGES